MLPGNSSGIPASYQANGRQYVVFSSVPRLAGRGGRGGRGDGRGGGGAAPPAAVEIAPDTPRGYIAFSLPAHEKTTPGIKN